MDDGLNIVLLVLLPVLLIYRLWEDEDRDGAGRDDGERDASSWALLVGGFALGLVCIGAGIRSVARENYVSAVTFLGCGGYVLLKSVRWVRDVWRQLTS